MGALIKSALKIIGAGSAGGGLVYGFDKVIGKK